MDINNVSGVRSDISEILNKIREVSNKSTVFSESSKVKESTGFEEIMSLAKNSVGQVNHLQTEAESIKTAYVSGDSNVSMSQVVVASQKSKLAFEGLLAVRNKYLRHIKK